MKVYYCDISDLNIEDVDYNSFSLLRKSYVESINDEKRKLQSVLVWKLLVYVLGSDDNFVQAENGSWLDKTGKVIFSISHSNNVVVVAVSGNQVGVDVEMIKDSIVKIKRRFDFVLDESLSVAENLTLAWTKEESKYKSNNQDNYFSKKIKDKYNNEYYVCACGKDDDCEFVSVPKENVIKNL